MKDYLVTSCLIKQTNVPTQSITGEKNILIQSTPAIVLRPSINLVRIGVGRTILLYMLNVQKSKHACIWHYIQNTVYFENLH